MSRELDSIWNVGGLRCGRNKRICDIRYLL